MGNEHQYDICSWQSVTTQVKEALETNSLTKSQASTMMRLYVTGVHTDEIVNQMKGEYK